MDIYILGAGGFAKEVALLAETLGYNICGFIDKEIGHPIKFGKKHIPLINEVDFINSKVINKNKVFLAIGIGDPNIISKLVIQFNEFEFPNLIHPSVSLNEGHVTIGKGNIICANTIFTTNIVIDDFNIFNLSVTIGHDVSIGSYNVVNPLVAISGGVIIDDKNMIGVSSTILQNIRIGSVNIIGACALLTKNIENNNLMIGVPAKNINS